MGSRSAKRPPDLSPRPGYGPNNQWPWPLRYDPAEAAESLDDEVWPENATVLDYLFARIGAGGSKIGWVTINGHEVPLDTVARKGNKVVFYFADRPMVRPEWRKFVRTNKGKERIEAMLTGRFDFEMGFPVQGDTAEVETMPKKLPPSAKSETTAPPSAKQSNREGRKLIGAYIDKADVVRLKMILTAEGSTVQDFFAAAVAEAIASGSAKALRVMQGSQSPAEPARKRAGHLKLQK